MGIVPLSTSDTFEMQLEMLNSDCIFLNAHIYACGGAEFPTAFPSMLIYWHRPCFLLTAELRD